MKKYESMLRFIGYIVDNVSFVRNKDFKNNVEGTEIDLEIIPKIKTLGNDMQIILQTHIFPNAKENNYPFEMKVDITGQFIVEGDIPDKFSANAIAILYPYVRAIVSTYTANANINPLILPPINVNKLIEDQHKN